MRQLLTIVYLITTSFLASSQDIQTYTLNYGNNEYMYIIDYYDYPIFLKDGIPDGTYFLTDSNGDTLVTMSVKNGLYDGLYYKISSNFDSIEMVNFREGKKDGLYIKKLFMEGMWYYNIDLYSNGFFIRNIQTEW